MHMLNLTVKNNKLANIFKSYRFSYAQISSNGWFFEGEQSCLRSRRSWEGGGEESKGGESLLQSTPATQAWERDAWASIT